MGIMTRGRAVRSRYRCVAVFPVHPSWAPRNPRRTTKSSLQTLPFRSVYFLHVSLANLWSQFSPEVVDQLAANLASPEVPPERQSTLDAHVRSRIQTELTRLRKEEEDVRQKIEQALEKENLDRERSMTGDGSEMGAVKDSVSLLNDLEEIRGKVDRFHGRKDLQELPDVKTYQEAVLSCYR